MSHHSAFVLNLRRGFELCNHVGTIRSMTISEVSLDMFRITYGNECTGTRVEYCGFKGVYLCVKLIKGRLGMSDLHC